MTLEAILTTLGIDPGSVPVIGGILFVLSCFVQVSKIPLNPWSWVARHVGRALNGELFKAVNDIDHRLDEMEEKNKERDIKTEEKEATDARRRILRFADELRMKVEHSEEFFTQTLEDVDQYEKYCEDHKDTFKNSKAMDAIDLIRETYHECKKENKFK